MNQELYLLNRGYYYSQNLYKISFNKVKLGRYAGHTLPWIIFRDPIHFLVGYHEGIWEKNGQGEEAKDLYNKIRRIQFPGFEHISYLTDESGKFITIQFSDNKFFVHRDYEHKDDELNESTNFEVIDLTFPMSCKTYTKAGYKRVIRSVKLLYFNSRSYPMDEKRCQDFFSNPANFDTSKSHKEEFTPNKSCHAYSNELKYFEPAPRETTLPEKETKTSERTLTIDVPQGILETIDKEFNGAANRRAKNVIKYIIMQHQLFNAPIIQYRQYSKKVKSRLLTSRFFWVWGKLVELGLLQEYKDEDDIGYHWKKRIAKRYRIAPEKIRSPYRGLHYDKKPFDIENSENPLIQYTIGVMKLIEVKEPPIEVYEKLRSTIYRKAKVRSTLHYMTPELIEGTNRGLSVKKTSVKSGAVPELKIFDMKTYVDGMANKLLLLKRNEVYASRNDLNQRLNHNLTNLNKLLFPCIRLNGEVVVEFDLSNSQPLIFSHVLQSILNGKNTEMFNDKFISEFIDSRSDFGVKNLHALTKEAKQFHRWCTDGIFYQKLSDIISDSGEATSRDEIKDGFIQLMFGKYNHLTKTKRLIQSRFPTIVDFLDRFKRGMYKDFERMVEQKSVPTALRKYFSSKQKGNKSPYNAGNDYLAIRLQEIEAHIFIDHILIRLMEKGIEAFSRHDSICCKESDQDKVLTILHEEFVAIFGQDEYYLKCERWE